MQRRTADTGQGASARARSRLLFITQQVDPAHPVLAATIPQIHALAERVDELTVFADRIISEALPSNCRASSFHAGNQLGRGLRFEAAHARELTRHPRPKAIVAHMCPLYAVLAAPLAKLYRIPILLWFAQSRAGMRRLRAAERLSTKVISIDYRSVPLDSRKVVPIGHGIDVGAFQPRVRRSHEGFVALALGRYSSSKGLPTIIEAARLARATGLDIRLELRGPTVTEAERSHKVELARLVSTLELQGQVTLGDAIPYRDVPGAFASADALVSHTRTGSADKVVYEAAAGGLPVLCSSSIFDTLITGIEPQLRYRQDDASSLAQALLRLAALSSESRLEIGRTLRERVTTGHSVAAWADRVLQVATSASRVVSDADTTAAVAGLEVALRATVEDSDPA